MHTYGLIGYRLGYSFSAGYFTEKFKQLGIEDKEYVNFELDSIHDFPSIFADDKNIAGLNCTIPYKQDLLQYMDELDEEAKDIGAVNTVKIINENGKRILKGYNTDVIGFKNSLKPMLNSSHKLAIILGTGGASKAIKFALGQLGIEFVSVSRSPKGDRNQISYADLSEDIIKKHTVIINSTPLGTFPKVDECPDIPYEGIGQNHVLFDLVYNPEVTKFLQNGLDRGAKTQNGLAMLHGQAEASWEIWNK